jgi:Uma2 family endonuclease
MAAIVQNRDMTPPATPGFPLLIHLRPIVELTEDQFFEFCQINRDLRIERTAQGELVIMPPAGWETSTRNAEITMQLRLWAKHDGTGTTTDSSGGFILPNTAVRSPDAAWVTRERLAPLTPEQRQKFLPLCPDFVLELRSPTDNLTALQAKMQEYLDNGARLGFLIDPEQKRVYVYRPQKSVEVLENPDTVSGDPELPRFVLDLREVW